MKVKKLNYFTSCSALSLGELGKELGMYLTKTTITLHLIGMGKQLEGGKGDLSDPKSRVIPDSEVESARESLQFQYSPFSFSHGRGECDSDYR